MAASGHKSDSGERVTASGHSNLPGGRGNAYADDVTGSGQLTATSHAESGHGETGINARIETGLSVNESFHAVTGSGQKTATGHEKRATGTMTVVVALDLLTANGKRRESENDGDVHGSYSSVTELSYPSVLLDPKTGNHGRITRGGETPKSLSIPHAVGRAARNGETTEAATRERGVCCEQAAPASPAPEGEGEERASPRAPDEIPETLPPLSLDLDRVGGEGASRDPTPGAPCDPPCFPCPPEGREEEEEEVPGRETPEGENVRGEASGAGGTEPEGREGFLRSL